MFPSADFLPRDMARRGVVRLVFLAVAIYFVAGLFYRKHYGDFYPALNMPSFAGIGLDSMTSHQGEITTAHLNVTFTDGSTAQVTPLQLSGGDIYPPVLINKFLPHDSLTTVPRIDATAADFLKRRLQRLFPGKTPSEAVVVLEREKFPLNRPNDRSVVETVTQRAIRFP